MRLTQPCGNCWRQPQMSTLSSRTPAWMLLPLPSSRTSLSADPTASRDRGWVSLCALLPGYSVFSARSMCNCCLVGRPGSRWTVSCFGEHKTKHCSSDQVEQHLWSCDAAAAGSVFIFHSHQAVVVGDVLALSALCKVCKASSAIASPRPSGK